MATSLVKNAVILTNKTLTKHIKQTNNSEIIHDGLFIINKVISNNIFIEVLATLISTEKLSPDLFIRHLIACKTVVASQIFLFDFELKKIKNITIINDFFRNLAISSALKSPIELHLQDSYTQNVKIIPQLKGLDLLRNEKYYRFSHIIGLLFQSVATFNHKLKTDNYYNFGFYLSLYFLLNREYLARQAKIPSLLDKINIQDLLIIKLNIMENYISAIAEIYPQNFNTFILLINKSIDKMKNLK